LESNNGEGAKPTRVQIHSNLSYDKLAKYLNELEMNEIILKNPLRITDKGRDFLQIYDHIQNESEAHLDQSSYGPLQAY
jgi:predicted transcriptional regulator